jgi:diguanylate cyclase (GGDEF)-like protein
MSAGPATALLMQRWPRIAAIPTEVSVLALMQLVGGTSLLLGAAFPMSDHAPTRLGLGLAALAFTLAAALLAGGARVPAAGIHAVLLIDLAGHGLLVTESHTSAGVMLTAFGYQWYAVYVAFFMSRRVMRLYAALITVSFGVALLIAQQPGTLAAWLIISATVWVAVIALGWRNEQLREQADTDHLTGLLNRHGLHKALTRERALAARTGNPLALAVLDLDDFKGVNDREGHAAGDALLVAIARAWSTELRTGDLLARHGGDEFVLALPATDAEAAAAVLERLRGAHAARWSAGVVQWQRGESVEACIARADRRLYAVKAASAGEGPAVAPATMGP